jgi:hypothetical protein
VAICDRAPLARGTEPQLPVAPPPHPRFPPTGVVADWIKALDGADPTARTKALDGLLGLVNPPLPLPREALPAVQKLASHPDLGTRVRAAMLLWQLDPTTEPDWKLFRAAIESDDRTLGAATVNYLARVHAVRRASAIPALLAGARCIPTPRSRSGRPVRSRPPPYSTSRRW